MFNSDFLIHNAPFESKSEIVVVEGLGEGESEARRMEKAPDEKERLKAAELLGKRFGLFSAVDVGVSSEGVQIIVRAAGAEDIADAN